MASRTMWICLYQIDKWAVPRQEKVCIVSFNYDTMLEKACDLVLGRRIYGIEDYVSAGHYPIIKSHGSVNWGIVIKKIMEATGGIIGVRDTIKTSHEYELSTEFHVPFSNYRVIPSDPRTYPLKAQPVLPAIAIPMEKRSETDFACPSGHVQILKYCIRETDRLLVIGWRGAEEHFLALWNDKSPVLQKVVVANASREWSHDTVQRLRRPGLIGTGTAVFPLEDGFSSFVTAKRFDEVVD